MSESTQPLVLGLVLCLLLWAPALRLLRRTREERLVGLFFLASGVGFGGRLAAVQLDGGVNLWLNGIGHTGLSLACIALYRFTRRVFRPSGSRGRIAEAVGIAASVLTLGLVFATDGIAGERSLSVLAANAARLASYAWSFAEALRYWRMMRRRMAVGLGDPLVANRFGLWSVWMGGLTFMLVVVLLLRITGLALGAGEDQLAVVLPLLRPLLAGVALVSGTAVWLTFFPPRFYLRWLKPSEA